MRVNSERKKVIIEIINKIVLHVYVYKQETRDTKSSYGKESDCRVRILVKIHNKAWRIEVWFNNHGMWHCWGANHPSDCYIFHLLLFFRSYLLLFMLWHSVLTCNPPSTVFFFFFYSYPKWEGGGGGGALYMQKQAGNPHKSKRRPKGEPIDHIPLIFITWRMMERTGSYDHTLIISKLLTTWSSPGKTWSIIWSHLGGDRT